MLRFYWLTDGVLAGCSRPGGDPRREPSAEELHADLRRLRAQGIGAVLTLTETPLEPEILAAHDLDVLHLPVNDLTAPHPEQLAAALRFIDRQRALGRAVAVHCLQGEGRTGTVLGAYLVRDGMTPEGAIAQLRSICPGAVGAEEQRRAIAAFGERRDWVI